MKKLLALILGAVSFLLLFSCSNPGDGNGVKETVKPELKSFVLKTAGGEFPGVIDQKALTVIISGLADPSLITSVEWTATDGAVPYPDPKSLIGKWGREERIVFKASDKQTVYTVILADYIPGDKVDARISPAETYGRVARYFFFDIKGRNKGISDPEHIDLLFNKDGMNGIRIPIYGDSAHGGHDSEGVIDGSVYTNVVNSVKAVREAFSGEKFYVFASKKLESKSSFPDWVKDGNGVIVDKYCSMLMDYFRFMKSQGIEIDYLGVDNESGNEGNITPEKFRDIVDKLEADLAKEGFAIPQMVGPERYSPKISNSDGWVKELVESGWGDRLDVYGTHYYPKHHTEEFRSALQSEHGYANQGTTRAFFATEPHWDNDEAAKNDMLNHAEKAMCTLWDCSDLGMDGFMWWAYQNTGSLRDVLMRTLSLAMYNAQPVKITDHDGEDTIKLGKLQTRAFIREGQIDIFVINMTSRIMASSGTEYKDYIFKIDGFTPSAGNISCTRWDDGTEASGSKVSPKIMEDDRFAFDIPVRSILHIKVNTDF